MLKSKFSKNKEMRIEEAFLAAYDQCSENILRHIYFRVSNMALAEDLTSETFLKTWQYLSGGKEVKNLKGFLYQVANNLIIDHYRQKPKEAVSFDNLPEFKDDKKSLSRDIDKGIEIGLLKKNLEQLSEDYRKILIYRFIDDLSIDEISKITDKSSVNIYVIIHRAIKVLKKKIFENENV
ncbi:hypothetical protein A2999_02520 [Candidatus Wolfebacteria bacterium RIFCSPLOWO2_01_FULL_38_11]|uniref:RNA polymerase, sigma-24 subunit, ECF subfamily n=2 Tax=Candidatus Wolfeibacteriota TaxID=1752735 RepID=A0A0G0FUG3_9BACT|nr:MAG: RNA polymerase, sigma-24 subunit, ECF subfamily [Candidatus Wolfebacteria bacterium GW2011_GWC1_37_10]OGM91341.1 MAG: hypothetical protein A2999_02520 [Candidatus Wolfebacteria bacterium RIFCSPLOWO2_01_FULL_38_11]